MKSIIYYIFAIICLSGVFSCTRNSSISDAGAKDTINPLSRIGFFVMDTIYERNDKLAPFDFTWNNSGNYFSFLQSMKGKVILINFWKLHCESCIAEMPNLKKISEEYKGDDFVVVGVNCDVYQDNIDSCLGYLKTWVKDTMALNYINMYSFIYPYKYGVTWLPTTLIIGRDGKIADTLIGEASYDYFKSRVDKHLK